MFAIAKLATLLSEKTVSISELLKEIPTINYQTETLSCMTEQKGSVIRNLVERTRDVKTDLLDGIKIHDGDAWVLILPHATEPIVNMYADGSNLGEVEAIMKKYKDITQDIITQTVV